MKRYCPVCGKVVDMQIDFEGYIVLFNDEGRPHSCARDPGEICPDCCFGRVTMEGRRPYKLSDNFKDCPTCRGTGINQRKEKKGMKRKLAVVFLVSVVMLACVSCATFENNTYKTIGVLGVSYDTSMKALADLKKQGKITDAQWAQIDQAGRDFYVVYNATIDAFQIYLATKNQPSQDKVILILSEASAKLGKVQEYYNIWKGVK